MHQGKVIAHIGQTKMLPECSVSFLHIIYIALKKKLKVTMYVEVYLKAYSKVFQG